MSWMQPLLLDLMVAWAAAIVLGMDLLAPHGRKRFLGDMTAFLLIGILALSFVTDTGAGGSVFSGAYVGGAWPLFFKRIFLLGGALTALASLEHVDRHFPNRQGEFYFLLLCCLLGMGLLPGARNLLLLIVCFELMGLPLSILAAYQKDEAGAEAPEAGLKLYLIGAASTAITLFGVSLVYGMTGTVEIAAVGAAPPSPLLSLGILMILAGLSFKIGLVPFHMWIPDTYQGAPTPFVAFLSVAPKGAGLAALVLIFGQGFAAQAPLWAPLLVALIVATLLLGNAMALAQTDVKRLLAYSGVAQIGYMLLGLASGGARGVGVGLFYLAGYTVTNLGVFFVVEAVARQSDAGGRCRIEHFDGLAQRAPGLALCLLIFLLSLAGVPFVVGFWAKLYVFLAAYQAGLGWLVLLGALLAVVALYYYLRVAHAAYINPPRASDPLPTPLGLRAAIALCLLGVIGMGVFPGPLLDAALHASRSLLGS